MVLIGLASVGVMMVMPQHANSNENVDWQAQRFTTKLQFAEDEALISGKELALVFKNNSYRFSFYDHGTQKWLAVVSEQIGSVVELPESITLEYNLLGSVWDEIETQDSDVFIDDDFLVKVNDANDDKIKSFSPQVFIMSSGEVTPFKVLFSKNGSDTTKRSSSLEVNMSGAITRTKSGEQ